MKSDERIINRKMIEQFYSFEWYCMNMFSFIACFIALYKLVGGLLFEVQTFINSQMETEVSPRGTRIFCKWLVGISGAGLIYLMGWLFMPVILCTPKILAGESIGIPGEILSNHKGTIAFYWIAVAITLLVLTGMRLLESLTKRVKRKKRQTEIYLWGREYSVFLLLQAFATSICMLTLVGSLAGGYTSLIEIIWKISAWADYVLVLINGMYIHQKLFIFNNGLVTYQKYLKAGFGQKEELEFFIDDRNNVKIKFKGEEMFVLECTPQVKRELEELRTNS